METLSAKLLLLSAFVFFFIVVASGFSVKKADLGGAWHSKEANGDEKVLIIEDGYFVFTAYNTIEKRFYYSWGGPLRIKDNTLEVDIHFDTEDNTRVGKNNILKFSTENNGITITNRKDITVLNMLDDGKSSLAGKWRITERKQGEDMVQMPLRARRTYKILSGTRFQWIAMNIETGEFSGTGGGTYTFENDKYTEHIEFFSRDSSRVGATLSFDGKLESGNWHHSGFSSKGDPIYEIWGRGD